VDEPRPIREPARVRAEGVASRHATVKPPSPETLWANRYLSGPDALERLIRMLAWLFWRNPASPWRPFAWDIAHNAATGVVNWIKSNHRQDAGEPAPVLVRWYRSEVPPLFHRVEEHLGACWLADCDTADPTDSLAKRMARVMPHLRVLPRCQGGRARDERGDAHLERGDIQLMFLVPLHATICAKLRAAWKSRKNQRQTRVDAWKSRRNQRQTRVDAITQVAHAHKIPFALIEKHVVETYKGPRQVAAEIVVRVAHRVGRTGHGGAPMSADSFLSKKLPRLRRRLEGRARPPAKRRPSGGATAPAD
jgi:hypothetical protein